MSDFQQVTKYLDITKTTRDTTVNTKPLSITKARRIKKLFKCFLMPEISGITQIRGVLLAQINFDMGEDFYIQKIIPGWTLTDLLDGAACCIRYREGLNVTRYLMDFTGITSVDNLTKASTTVQAAPYNGELIKRYFSLELWGYAPTGTLAVGPVRFVTSLAELPTSPNQIDYGTEVEGTLYERDDLVVALPEDVPTTYVDAMRWTSN